MPLSKLKAVYKARDVNVSFIFLSNSRNGGLERLLYSAWAKESGTFVSRLVVLEDRHNIKGRRRS
jgi:hypothetical protein